MHGRIRWIDSVIKMRSAQSLEKSMKQLQAYQQTMTTELG
jgi:hypothetical protein